MSFTDFIPTQVVETPDDRSQVPDDAGADENAAIAAVEQFLGAVVTDMGGAMTVAMICLGDQLGLYEAMAGRGSLTAAELGHATGCNERLVHEWLMQQSAAGYVVAILGEDGASDTFELPTAHAAALAVRSSPAFVAGGQHVTAAMFRDLDAVAAAFRRDGAMPWGHHDRSLFHAVGEFFRPAYDAHLTTDWIPSVPGLDAALQRGGRVVDVGCGLAHSAIQIARAYPRSRVVGIDNHRDSIEAARELTTSAGVDDRVFFEVETATGYGGEYDLALFGDALHDLGDPIGAARHARSRLADGGWLVAVEPFALDDRADNLATPTAKVLYAGSTFLCTPNALSQPGGEALGAQAGEAGMRRVLQAAGFERVERLAETPFHIVYGATDG